MCHPKWDTIIETHQFILTCPYSHWIDCNESTCQNAAYHEDITTLSPTYRLIHAYIHSDIIDRSYAFKRIDLRQLYEMSLIIDNHKLQINWKYIEDFFKTHSMWDKFNNKLCLINELFKVRSYALRENKKCKIHLSILYIFFKYQNTYLIKKFHSAFQDLRFQASLIIYRRGLVGTSDSHKKEYIIMHLCFI